MAQTRKKRKHRHRGTQAGTVEARGRTSRPSGSSRASGSAKKPANRTEAKQSARDRRAARFDQPPTWRSALNRSLFAAALFGVSIVLLFKRPVVSGFALAAVMVLLYLPMSYYTDMFLYRRRQRQKQAGKG
jgi:Flp pilus assembly protein TadB